MDATSRNRLFRAHISYYNIVSIDIILDHEFEWSNKTRQHAWVVASCNKYEQFFGILFLQCFCFLQSTILQAIVPFFNLRMFSFFSFSFSFFFWFFAFYTCFVFSFCLLIFCYCTFRFFPFLSVFWFFVFFFLLLSFSFFCFGYYVFR